MVFFFKKKLRYLKSKISTKFYRLLFRFYFFSIFGILFSISPIQSFPKIMEFFEVFYCKGQRFYQRFMENSKSSFKKLLICELIFSKILQFTFCFFIFLLFSTFYFLFRVSVRVKKLQKFLCVFVLWMKDFIKEFWKIVEYFSKKYRHLKSKILRKSIVYYLFFFLFFQHFGNLFFLFHLSKLVKKF